VCERETVRERERERKRVCDVTKRARERKRLGEEERECAHTRMCARCVQETEREREKERSVCVCERESARERKGEEASVMCVCVCVCVRERELAREKVVGGEKERALGRVPTHTCARERIQKLKRRVHKKVRGNEYDFAETRHSL